MMATFKKQLRSITLLTVNQFKKLYFQYRIIKRTANLYQDHNNFLAFLLINSKNHEQYYFFTLKQPFSIEIMINIVLHHFA